MREAEGFDKVENGLLALDPDQWEGFVFARFTKDVPSLRAALGDFPHRMASHKSGRMRCAWRVTLHVACNCKLILENTVETCPTGIVHRDSVGARHSRSPATKENRTRSK